MAKKYGDPKAKTTPPPQPPKGYSPGKVADTGGPNVSTKFGRAPYGKTQAKKPSPVKTV